MAIPTTRTFYSLAIAMTILRAHNHPFALAETKHRRRGLDTNDIQCFDSPTFRYQGHPKKDCAVWAAAKPDTRCQNEYVRFFCPSMCNADCQTASPDEGTQSPTYYPTLYPTASPTLDDGRTESPAYSIQCIDSPTFRYQGLSQQDCAVWAAAKPDTRCQNEYVRFFCPSVCNADCQTANPTIDDGGTKSPTYFPTESPTYVPTLYPHDGHTESPTSPPKPPSRTPSMAPSPPESLLPPTAQTTSGHPSEPPSRSTSAPPSGILSVSPSTKLPSDGWTNDPSPSPTRDSIPTRGSPPMPPAIPIPTTAPTHIATDPQTPAPTVSPTSPTRDGFIAVHGRWIFLGFFVAAVVGGTLAVFFFWKQYRAKQRTMREKQRNTNHHPIPSACVVSILSESVDRNQQSKQKDDGVDTLVV